MHPQKSLPEDVGDSEGNQDFYPLRQVVTETTRDTDRQQNTFQFFDQNLVSSLH